MSLANFAGHKARFFCLFTLMQTLGRLVIRKGLICRNLIQFAMSIFALPSHVEQSKVFVDLNLSLV